MNDVQGLVDAMAASLNRPVGVDDSRFRLVAHSAHGQEVDTVRLAKLLQREANSRVVGWLEKHGVRDADTYVRVPRCQRLEMAARIIIPLRFDGELVGFLALIDEPVPFTDGDVHEAMRYVSDLSLALFRQRSLHLDDRDPVADLAREILGLSPEGAEPSTAGPGVSALLGPRAHYACLVARAAHVGQGGSIPERSEVRLAASVERLRQTVGAAQVVALSEGDVSIAIVGFELDRELSSLAARLLSDLEARFADQVECRAVVGVGEAVADLSELRRSFDQARDAAFLAGADQSRGPVVRWERLGADGTIAKLLDESDPKQALPSSMRTLLEHPDADTFICTLDAYLENGADTGATAAILFIHRTSLYHRLRRIEEIVGVDLSTGDGRLEMHLGLRLWRLCAGADQPRDLTAASPSAA